MITSVAPDSPQSRTTCSAATGPPSAELAGEDQALGDVAKKMWLSSTLLQAAVVQQPTDQHLSGMPCTQHAAGGQQAAP